MLVFKGVYCTMCCVVSLSRFSAAPPSEAVGTNHFPLESPFFFNRSHCTFKGSVHTYNIHETASGKKCVYKNKYFTGMTEI